MTLQIKEDEEIRTDMYCHNCKNNFLGTIDYRINGRHKIVCPYCAHIHYRQIKDGVITESRWDSDNRKDILVPVERLWKHNSLQIQTSSTSRFLRDKWLNYNK